MDTFLACTAAVLCFFAGMMSCFHGYKNEQDEFLGVVAQIERPRRRMYQLQIAAVILLVISAVIE